MCGHTGAGLGESGVAMKMSAEKLGQTGVRCEGVRLDSSSSGSSVSTSWLKGSAFISKNMVQSSMNAPGGHWLAGVDSVACVVDMKHPLWS